MDGCIVLVAVEHGDGNDAAIRLVVEKAAHNLIVLDVEQTETAPL